MEENQHSVLGILKEIQNDKMIRTSWHWANYTNSP
jgi:hypothetical protein